MPSKHPTVFCQSRKQTVGPRTGPVARISERGSGRHVNRVSYLSPASDQKVFDDFTAPKRRARGLTDGDDRMLPLLPVAGTR